MSASSGLRRLYITLFQFFLVAAFVSVWEVSVRAGWVSQFYFGLPSRVWTTLVQALQTGLLWENIYASMSAVFIAIVIGVPLGLFTGFALGLSKLADDIVSPFLLPINSIPRIALAPMFILWFGLTIWSKVFLAVTLIFFMVLYAARAAVLSIDPDIQTVARVVGIRRFAMLRKVVLPASIPTLFAALRLGITYALLGVIASEMIAARRGLGQVIVDYSGRMVVEGVLAMLLVLAIISMVLGVVIDLLERYLLRWQ